MIRLGIIGYGYWGPNLVRNFAENDRTEVKLVSDLQQDRLDLIGKRYPAIGVTTDYRDILKSDEVDAVAIATPVSSHFEIALAALKAGKHVLVEKPMTETTKQAEELIETAKKNNLVLFVDHTFIYTPAVRKIKAMIEEGDLGEVYYYDSVRINLGLFQHDVNVIWDLAVHDLAIMDFLIKEKPTAVSATGISHIEGQPENIAYITVFFESKLIAHVHVNWLAPVKIRQLLVGGSKKMIVFDDLEPSEKIKIYDKGVTVTDSDESKRRMLVGYRTGDMLAPQLGMGEALKSEVEHFADCIEKGETPTTGGEAGLLVVKVLEAATESMEKQGKPVIL